MKTISLKLPDDVDARLEARAKYLDGKGGSEVSCLDLVRDLVGRAKGPGDLASNKKHLRGYGR